MAEPVLQRSKSTSESVWRHALDVWKAHNKGRSYPSDNLPEEAPVLLCANGERMSAFSNRPAYPSSC